MTTKYQTIPTLTQWKSDSSVTFAIRSNDEGLMRIDALVERYHAAKTKGHYRSCFVLCMLFLAVNYWVKRHNAIPQQAHRSVPFKANVSAPSASMQPGYVNVSGGAMADSKKRYPAMMELFDVVVRELTQLCEASGPADLEQKIIELVGVGIKQGGVDTDASHNMQAFSDDELAQYRVWFKKGRAYQIQWWRNPPSLRLQLAESVHGYAKIVREGCATSPNFCPFVMTTDLEMYMTKHSIPEGVFHSSYTNQNPIFMAGTILVEHGVIRAVRNDSGHYQPNNFEFRKFLVQLGMIGVSLSNITIYDFSGDPVSTADRFLADGTRHKLNPPAKVKNTAYA